MQGLKSSGRRCGNLDTSGLTLSEEEEEEEEEEEVIEESICGSFFELERSILLLTLTPLPMLLLLPLLPLPLLFESSFPAATSSKTGDRNPPSSIGYKVGDGGLDGACVKKEVEEEEEEKEGDVAKERERRG